MSVRACSHCRREYWAYPGHWPAGYCSTPCFEDRDKRVRKLLNSPPEQAVELVELIREHLATVHNTADLSLWFPGCVRCDVLEECLTLAVREAG